ncbi:Os02g0462000, partial [Oryza sativa Japonica Group]
ASNSGREATVLCAPRPRRIQIHPCSADLILSPPHFLLTSNTTNKNSWKSTEFSRICE